ncbi:MBL fold metallo-hydrolase [Actinorhabdospora filicis]|uniref:MBL fold metallo-hydrolase n=1 Tax=Actinorhabdospora filicis TaxID=1785913 RepID=UPI0025538BE4|nr:MBL fold metallo-hydrolase [Actinorhabdospora filicis]
MSDRVWVWRYPVLDVNLSLVVGDAGALLVDTLSGPSQARELADGVRAVTSLPVRVVNTHAHFDHCFGNGVIAEVLGVEEFWAGPGVAQRLSGDTTELRERIVASYGHLDAVMAAELPALVPLPPNRLVEGVVELDLGGVVARVWPVGHAHSPGDVVVACEGVVICGDIVEEGAPPQTGDADVRGWVAALGRLLPEMTGPVVPGHGAVVDAAFVAAQMRDLEALA